MLTKALSLPQCSNSKMFLRARKLNTLKKLYLEQRRKQMDAGFLSVRRRKEAGSSDSPVIQAEPRTACWSDDTKLVRDRYIPCDRMDKFKIHLKQREQVMAYLSYMPGSSGILFSSFFVYLLAENSWHFLFYFSVLVIIIDIIFQSVVCKAKLIMIVFRFEYVLRNLGSCSIKK